MEELRQKSKESKAKTTPSSETKKKGGMVTRANKTVPYKDPAWYMDSAASYHMTYDPGLFQSMRSSSKEVELADGTTIRAKGVGTIEIDILVAGETVTQPLFDVYYIPDLDSNLLSIGCIERKGYSINVRNGKMTVEDSYEVRMEATRINTLYILNQPDETKTHRAMVTKTDTNDVEIWH